MTETTFDEFDHESHIRDAIRLAHEAADRGDFPFGSVLVRDDTVVISESNRERTEDDFRRHPELHLAYRAHKNFGADERAEAVMYTSTEPCPMCASGIATAGFGRVVYSVGGDELGEFTGSEPPVRSAEIFSDDTEVLGPIVNDEGRQVHREFDWDAYRG